MIIKNLNKLNKSLEKYKLKSNPNLLKKEREINLNINYQGKVSFHSDHRTGIRWAVQHLAEDNVELKYMYIEDDAIISIDIFFSVQLLSFKAKERKTKGASSAFSMPFAYRDSDWIKK